MIKQVIVYRKFYPSSDGSTQKDVRVGKVVAQCGHAITKFMVDKILKNIPFTQSELYWMNNGYPKITTQVDTEEQLIEIYNKAKESGLQVNLIQDSGKTEFNGQLTYTCLAIGPDWNTKIDPITENLKLL